MTPVTSDNVTDLQWYPQHQLVCSLTFKDTSTPDIATNLSRAPATRHSVLIDLQKTPTTPNIPTDLSRVRATRDNVLIDLQKTPATPDIATDLSRERASLHNVLIDLHGHLPNQTVCSLIFNDTCHTCQSH